MKLFNKKDKENLKAKYNIWPSKNAPECLYGVPNFIIEEERKKEEELEKKYDIDPEDNIPEDLYGIPNYLLEEENDEDSFDPENNTPVLLYGVPFKKEWTKDDSMDDDEKKEV